MKTAFFIILTIAAPRLFANVNGKYSPQSIQKVVAGVTDHGFFDYLRRLGIREEEVLEAKGKRWLSVGEGRSNFVFEAHQRGVDAFAFDALVVNPYAPDRTQIGLAQNLPYKEGEFDRVVAVWLIDYFFDPKSFNDPVSGKKAILEMIRVTKIGGDVRINPVQQGAVFSILDELKKQGAIEYQVLPYFKGEFKLTGKKRLFELAPLDPTTPGSIRITRLK